MEFLEPYSEEIKKRFRSINKIGEGAYGEVWIGYDTHFGERVALKQVRLLGGRKSGIPRAIFREIEALRQLKHQNIVDLISIFPQNTHLMLVFEYLPTDLQIEITKAKDFFPLSTIKYYSFQIFSALSHCHQHHIIHRDLKPANILITSNGVVKLADFGLARVYDSSTTNSMSHQIATRWYRPPELLFASRHYTESVDIWSAAVIVAELVTLTPLFPGNNDIDQIFKVFQIMGTPTSDSWPVRISLRFLSQQRRNMRLCPIMGKLFFLICLRLHSILSCLVQTNRLLIS